MEKSDKKASQQSNVKLDLSPSNSSQKDPQNVKDNNADNKKTTTSSVEDKIMQNTSNNESKSIIFILKKIFKLLFTWQTILGILAILTFAILIYDHIDHKTQIERVKESIESQINDIRTTSHPTNINVTDSTGELHFIKDYQQAALDFCDLYESFASSNSANNYDNINDIALILANSAERSQKINLLYEQMMKDLQSLIELGIKNNIKEYNFLDASKQKDAVLALKEKNEFLINNKSEIIKYAEKKDLKKCIEIAESSYSDLSCLNADNKLLIYISDSNKILNNRLNKIMHN